MKQLQLGMGYEPLTKILTSEQYSIDNMRKYACVERDDSLHALRLLCHKNITKWEKDNLEDILMFCLDNLSCVEAGRTTIAFADVLCNLFDIALVYYTNIPGLFTEQELDSLDLTIKAILENKMRD